MSTQRNSNSTKVDCSEECAVFLTVELNDPKIRKWEMILIKSVLYLYALVMFCIFIGACFTFVEMLIIATFIEEAKLFTRFVLLIIDSFNGIKVLIKIIDFILKLKLVYAKLFLIIGKRVHFDLVDVKFNVNSKGNGWSADFTYSEYLLDIIIFLLSTFLCIKVFKSFAKHSKKYSSIEDFETRGTHRVRNSSNTSRVMRHKS
jgi:hypothetical protein